MSTNKDASHECCKDCEHLAHCFGRETASKIEHLEPKDESLSRETCRDFYPIQTSHG